MLRPTFRAKKLVGHPNGGSIAIWSRPASGYIFDAFDDPVANIADVAFHSDLQYLCSLDVRDVTVSHAQVNGVTGTGITGAPTVGATPQTSSQPITDGQIVQANHTLYTHSLGYVPWHQVIYNDEIVGGTAVQSDADGRARRVTSYATSSIIGLRETGVSTASNLGSVSRDYTVVTFRDPAPDPSKPLFKAKISTGEIILGRGKIDHTMKALRRAAAGETTVFYIPVTRTMDIRGGAVRTIAMDGTITDTGLYTGALFEVYAIPVTFDDY